MTKQEAPNNEDRGSGASKLRLAPPRPIASDDEEQPRSSKRNGSKNQSGLSLAPPLPLSQRNQRSEQQDWWPSGWSQGDSSAVEETDSSMPSSIGHELGPGAHRIAGTEGGIGNDDLSSAWTSSVLQNGVEAMSGEVERSHEEEQLAHVEGILAPNRDETRANMLNRAIEAGNVQVVGNQKKRRRWITVGVVSVALILAAIGASLGVVLGGGGGAPSSAEGPTTAPTIPPTPIPTSPRFAEVASLVQLLFGTVLDDPLSPQYRAAEWLADVDATFDLSDEDRFRQRYAAVVLYYATGGGTSWVQQMNFLTPGINECEWNEPPGDHVTPAYSPLNMGLFCNDPNNTWAITQIAMVLNDMVGSLPTEIGAFSSLQFIYLPENKLEGSIPLSIFNLTDLVELWMQYNAFTGTIPTEIGQLTNLAYLWFQDASFDSTIPSQIGQLSSLQTLVILNTLLRGTIPETLLQLSNLQELWLAENDLTGTLPNSFPSAWPDLEYLGLSNSRFSGTIPQNIGSLLRLKSVYLDNNDFTGQIPQSFGDLPLLEVLWLYNNNLSGTLPEEWSGSLFQSSPLTQLILENNTLLSGTIPVSLGSLTALGALSLAENRLTGTLPIELGNATRLYWLSLFDNDLIGTVPRSFQKLTLLEHLYLQLNRLEDDISFLCNDGEYLFPNMDWLWADCFEEITCPCCNYCCNAQDVCEFL